MKTSEVSEDFGSLTRGLLSQDEQQALWRLMLKGASPALACQQLGLSLIAYLDTIDHDAEFQASMQRAIGTLSDNVVASLYRTAIEGSVYAQKFWLEHRPAALWASSKAEEAEPDEFAHLSDRELAAQLSETSGDLAAAGQRLEAADAV